MEKKELIAQLSNIILQNQTGMVKEQDLINLCADIKEYQDTIPELVKNFKKIGLSIIRTPFQGAKYFVTTAPGKDQRITPSMYGTLALILAFYSEIGSTIELLEMKKIFKDVWQDVEGLVSIDYLKIVKNKEIEKIEITPLAKAAFKNILKEISLKKLIETFSLD